MIILDNVRNEAASLTVTSYQALIGQTPNNLTAHSVSQTPKLEFVSNCAALWTVPNSMSTYPLRAHFYVRQC